MAALQRVNSSLSTTASGYGGADPIVSDQFPVGLRVLVVDDDTTCLKILEQMLRRCHYHVTTCCQAIVALKYLRERKGSFDVVLSDVHMPDMDGYKLLEHIGLEMDLPVIMMSADGRTSAVMKGIQHRACDYLIKPIREEELKNLWQHVVRKKWNENKELEHSESLEDSDWQKRGHDDVDHASSVNEGTGGVLKAQKRRSNSKEDDDGELESEDPSAAKKPRVVWSVELHQQFVSAVNQLGIDKAVPKRILELMNVPGLTRENVASHLQKFRLYLKRLSGVAQQGGMANSFCGPLDLIAKVNALGRFDIQALAISGQIPPQILAALHAEHLGRPADSHSLITTPDQSAILQASIQGRKCNPVEQGVSYGKPKCQPNISNHFSQSIVSVEDISSGIGSWPSNSIATVASSSNHGGRNTQNGNLLMDMLHQQHLLPQMQQPQKQSSLSEASCAINVQPSCLVVPSQASASFQAGNSPASVNQTCNFNRNPVIDYSLLSSQSDNSSLSSGHILDGDLKATGVVSGYAIPGSVSLALPSCCINVESIGTPHIQNSNITFRDSRQLPGPTPNICEVPNTYGKKPHDVLDQGPLRNLGFVGKGTSIPSWFAVVELEPPMSNLNHGKTYMESTNPKVKQEPSTEHMGDARVGAPILQQFPSNDLMSVFTK